MSLSQETPNPADEVVNGVVIRRHRPVRAGGRPVEEVVSDGFEVPAALRYDPSFADLPEESRIAILRLFAEGKIQPQHPSAMVETERRTVRMRRGQWPLLEETAARAAAYHADRRRSLTPNSVLREALEFFFAIIVPHLELEGVSTAEGLRQSISRAFLQAASEAKAPPV